MSTVYTFQRGETVLIALDVVSGDQTTVTSITGSLKQQLAPGTETPFNISARAGGWTLTIDAGISATLAAGFYLAQATLEVPGQIVKTDPVQVRLT